MSVTNQNQESGVSMEKKRLDEYKRLYDEVMDELQATSFHRINSRSISKEDAEICLEEEKDLAAQAALLRRLVARGKMYVYRPAFADMRKIVNKYSDAIRGKEAILSVLNDMQKAVQDELIRAEQVVVGKYEDSPF